MSAKRKFLLSGLGLIAIIGIGIIGCLTWKNKTDIQNNNYNRTECPYLDTLLDAPPNGEGNELSRFEKVPRDFVHELWKKGYHWIDIVKLWEWKIPETEVPDLKTERRIGVIRELSTMYDFDRLQRGELDYDNPQFTPLVGKSRNLVVICRRVPAGGGVNIDDNYLEDDRTWNEDKSTTLDYIKKVINLALAEENLNSQQYQISVLTSFGIEWFQKESEINWGKTAGSSGGSTIYLALISALRQKLVSQKVAATGTIITKEMKVKNLASGIEVTLSKGDNIPISGLKEKVAVAAEKGFNQIVLSKYHKTPDILTKTNQDGKKTVSANYEEKVPYQTRKIMTVHWTQNIQQLRKLVLENKLS